VTVLNEPVDVAFSAESGLPVSIRWHGRDYRVLRVLHVADVRGDSGYRLFHLDLTFGVPTTAELAGNPADGYKMISWWEWATPNAPHDQR
jgi:hypothetical protein